MEPEAVLVGELVADLAVELQPQPGLDLVVVLLNSVAVGREVDLLVDLVEPKAVLHPHCPHLELPLPQEHHLLKVEEFLEKLLPPQRRWQ